MAVTHTKYRILATALFALSGGVWVSQASEASAAKTPPAKNSAPANTSKAGEAASEAAKNAASEARKRTEAWMAEHEALSKQLSKASEEQKKEILEKMEAQEKKFREALNALHKQMKDEQRRQRQSPTKR